MKSILTVIWLGLFIMGGYSLYRITFEVEHLESQLTELNRGILEEQETIHILHAEWSYLTRPQRIEQISAVHLDHYIQASPDQIAYIDQIPFRMPEILSVDAEFNSLGTSEETGTGLANTSLETSSHNIVKVTAPGD